MIKLKIYYTLTVVALFSIAYGLLQLEFVQKKLFDIKADALGSARTVIFYSPLTGEKISSYSDKDIRYETKPTGAISVWLGSQSRKVESNLPYIIEDK